MSKVKIAYINEDIDCQGFILKEGTAFFVNKEDPKVLEGSWHGGTDMIKRFRMDYDWMFEGKITYYEVRKKCACCKYTHFQKDGLYCGNGGYCVQP